MHILLLLIITTFIVSRGSAAAGGDKHETLWIKTRTGHGSSRKRVAVRHEQNVCKEVYPLKSGILFPASNMAAVDVEDESILASIFRDSFPDSWRDNPDFTAYLSELSSFGVEKLSREPERLAEERAQILQQTRELAFSNYQTFIRTADCTEHIYRDFGRVESSVSRLLDKLPGFGERCRSVVQRRPERFLGAPSNILV